METYTTDLANAQAVVANGPVIQRAKEVERQLHNLKNGIEDSFLDMCDLLMEAQEGEYHRVWGFNTFSEWVEQGSSLELSARQAYYLVNISKNAKALGIDRDLLRKAKLSKLKEIFTLDPVKHGEHIKELVQQAADGVSLQAIKAQVKSYAEPGIIQPSYVTVKLEPEVKETFDEAVELARRNYGSTVGHEGEVKDISISKALELILVSYLQDPNNHPQQ
jgi:hypothetical protein